MPKNAKSAKKTAKKTPVKKTIAKSKAPAAMSALMRSKTIFHTKKTAGKTFTAPKKATKTKDWEPGYKKQITMFKSQADYFQLNE